MVLKCLNFSTGGIFLWFSNDYGPEMVDFLNGGILCADYGPEMDVFFCMGGIFCTDNGPEMVDFLHGGILCTDIVLECLVSNVGSISVLLNGPVKVEF